MVSARHSRCPRRPTSPPAVAATSRSLPILALVLALCVPQGALADLWYEHYAAAERALADGEWAKAIDQINEALAKKGDPGARARTYGMRFTAYFPYLKLGIAYYGLGQPDAALQAFETEERLGAVAESERDLEELRRYRGLAEEAQREAERLKGQRIEALVRDSLAEARIFEEQGRIEDALTAVGQALAVSPEDPEASVVLDRLRGLLARAEQESDRLRRRSALVDRGRELLDAGDLSEAASVLRQALALGEDEEAEARALLEQAQSELRASLDTGSRRTTAIESSLGETRRLRDEGRIEEALEGLQSILAIDPGNRTALDLERDLLEMQAADARERQLAESVTAFLAETRDALAAGRFEDALRGANRALALDAANADALDQLARAYSGLNRSLLGGLSQQENFPPAIDFADARQERADGSRAQVTRSPDFRLSGMVIDDSPVEIDFYAGDGVRLEGIVGVQELGRLFVTSFRLEHQLAAGPTVFRLVATDPGGLRSSAEYAVVYRRPLARSPWPYGLAGVVVAGLAATALMSRRKKKRRLLERRFNPYTAGSPVLDEKLFFGRQQLIERILQTLHNNSLLLHGERRIGKTTLQHQLKRRLEALEDPEYAFFPVYIDLQGTPEEQFFATVGEEIFEELEEVLGGLSSRLHPDQPYTFRDLVADLRAVLKRLRRRTDKRLRLVLLIDEVDELNAYDPRINQKLRSLFMKSFAEDLVAVVSGVAIKREWEREGSPWYNFFEEIDVGPLDREAARRLIEKPIQGLFRVDEDAAERIIELAEGRPYRIQHLCMLLVNHMYEAGRRRIEIDDVEAVHGERS